MQILKRGNWSAFQQQCDECEAQTAKGCQFLQRFASCCHLSVATRGATGAWIQATVVNAKPSTELPLRRDLSRIGLKIGFQVYFHVFTTNTKNFREVVSETGGSVEQDIPEGLELAW
jgi:hypothetical protein